MLYDPARHADEVEFVLPAGHTYPALHGPEHVEEVRPVVAPYRPAGQSAVHVEFGSLTVSPYFPAGHGVHSPSPPGLNVPGPQLTAVAFVDPTGHAYPALHGPVHDDEFKPAMAPN